ncbi:DEAD/DEAH box helicase [Myxococcus llanfairpwllgwyngyllgogerychwyrndrobwllllantysiliogogogochensis]|uniref:DEAD/DEAH box helicase n=1 Tax=Myxococcus llanfairpwllgwyngyllgogerychwyrndrobwllllantysiliogogogochensis TaxID=2590453 RepID=A0A540X692_9BACT|nr:DEAD/DEAH box helicase [Myxococcus llanfairpwllgwyngyllgogerychwyrndrobwllllantysiliogogogochensis]TQF16777.1 DEAD/DEAH box helicase [Myxococcus llanfairpwllgwyngyllgogerychwyrndrobwllllantysiliogogogochensis]
MTFSTLGLSDALVRAMSDLDCLDPTPVQRAAIPAVLRGGDVWASAPTGSGKTAAFVLPLLEALAQSPGGNPRRTRALIVVPTRELAAQIADAVEQLGRHLPRRLKTCLAVGGVSINPQMLALRGGADLVVATPGRALDLVDQNALRLSTVETLVLDEADQLLSLGFADELTRLLALLPKRRQNLLFSATFPPAVGKLAEQLLHEPTRIDIQPEALPGADLVVQRAIEVDAGRRTMLLRHLLETHAWSHVLTFVASRYGSEHVAMKLNRAGITAAPLHGELSQGARTRALADFKAKRVQVLVATDVAARGIDIVQLPAVVNYDLPRSPVDYVHRIGRTGRAGEPGMAISFISADTQAHFRLIERRHQLRLAREQLPGFEPVDVPTPPLDVNGGVKGKRKSKKDKLREAAAEAASRPPSRRK